MLAFHPQAQGTDMSILKSTLPGATLVCALTDVTQAHAQAYPHKWVRMIIPFVPGGRVGGWPG